MDTNERQLIDGLFGKLRQVDVQAPARDAEAEALIRQHLGQNPAAPYYMAQALIVQEHALANAQQRVQELERQLAQRPSGGGSFLGSLFGSGSSSAAPSPSRSRIPSSAPVDPGYQGYGGSAGYGQRSPWGGGFGGRGFGGGFGGGGFLAGAAQTAIGVAGGVLVADAISSAFGAGAAEAGEVLPNEVVNETVVDEPAVDDNGYGADPNQVGYDDSDPGFDAGGGFGDEEI
jgi:hypothetical protein